ncbi:unnamed protein product [Amoebophrya sp. A120]|nr:unnamed protein product [Amoebophrya sp. A120]|eukprot:GSA120T00002630001.1
MLALSHSLRGSSGGHQSKVCGLTRRHFGASAGAAAVRHMGATSKMGETCMGQRHNDATTGAAHRAPLSVSSSCNTQQRALPFVNHFVNGRLYDGRAGSAAGKDTAAKNPGSREDEVDCEEPEQEMTTSNNNYSKDVTTMKTSMQVVSPVWGTPVSEFPVASEQVVRDTVSVAQAAFDQKHRWAGDRGRRVRALQKMAEKLRDPAVLQRLAESETEQIGRPLREMRFQLGRLHEWFDYYAAVLRVHEDSVLPTTGNLNYTKRVPLGVVAQITPWNHPLLITVKKLAPALAAGNAVVVKPSELAPNSIILLAQLLHDACNGSTKNTSNVENTPDDGENLLPDGILNILLGDGKTGAALVQDPRISKVDFTGGPGTGKVIGAAAGANLAGYIAELGGKSPMLVFEPGAGLVGADREAYLDQMVNGVVFGCFIASGQTCIAGTRLLLQESLREEFLEKLVKKVAALRVGDPVKPETGLGPVITGKQLDFIQDTVNKAVAAGAKVLCGGKRKQDFTAPDAALNAGNFFEATVLLSDTHENPAFHTEMFGPVLSVTCFREEADAVRLANATEFGLGCSIWTPELAKAHRIADQIQSGIIWINDHHKNDPSSPWGGLTKMSGIGRENGIDAFHEYTQSKSIVVNPAPYTGDWFGNLQTKYN